MTETEPTPAPPPTPPPSSTSSAPEFSVEDLTWRARSFGTSRAIVRAALRAAQRDHATVDDAQQLIDAYLAQPANVGGRK